MCMKNWEGSLSIFKYSGYPPSKTHRSNRKFNIPLWENLGHLNIFCAQSRLACKKKSSKVLNFLKVYMESRDGLNIYDLRL